MNYQSYCIGQHVYLTSLTMPHILPATICKMESRTTVMEIGCHTGHHNISEEYESGCAIHIIKVQKVYFTRDGIYNPDPEKYSLAFNIDDAQKQYEDSRKRFITARQNKIKAIEKEIEQLGELRKLTLANYAKV